MQLRYILLSILLITGIGLSQQKGSINSRIHALENGFNAVQKDSILALVKTTIDTILSGTATLNVGADSVIVTHGIGTAPSINNINVIPQGDIQGLDYWVEDITATTFKIKISDRGYLPLSSSVNFSWQVFNASLSLNSNTNIVNVSDYMDANYLTDGSVDITSYFNLAKNDLANKRGGTIYLPKGKFKGQILIDQSDMRVKGQGRTYQGERDGTLILPRKDNDTIVVISEYRPAFGVTYSTLEDLSINGVNSDGDTARIGVYFRTGANCEIKGLNIFGFHGGGIDTTYGIKLDNGNSVILLPPINIDEVDIGIYANSFEDLIINSNRIINFIYAGIFLKDCNNTQIITSDVEADTDTVTSWKAVIRHGIWNRTSLNTLISGVYMEHRTKYGGYPIYLDETDGYFSNVVLIGGHIACFHNNVKYGMGINATRTNSYIYGTQFTVEGGVAPIKMGASRYRFVSGDFTYTNHSTASLVRVNVDRYTENNFDYTDLNQTTPQSDGLTHIDKIINGTVLMTDSSMFVKGITVPSAMTNYTTGFNTGRVYGSVTSTGTGETYGGLYCSTNDTIQVTIKLANYLTANPALNFMKVKMQMRWGGVNMSDCFWGEADINKQGLRYNFNVDSIFIPQTTNLTPIFEFGNVTDSTFNFRIIPPVAYVYPIYFNAGWTEAVNVKEVEISKFKNPYANGETYFFAQSLDTTLEASQLYKIDGLITRLKDSLSISALSDYFDVLYVMADSTREASLKDLVNLTYNLTIPVGTVTFTSNEGFNSDGISGYMNTNYNPTIEADNVSLNSFAVTLYSRSNVNEVKYDYYSNNSLYGRLRSGGNIYNRVYDGGNQLFANADSRGCYTLERISSDSLKIFKNGVLLNSKYEVSTSLANADVGIFGSTYAGIYSTKQLSFFAIHKASTSLETRKIHNCIEWYMDQKGKGVIP